MLKSLDLPPDNILERSKNLSLDALGIKEVVQPTVTLERDKVKCMLRAILAVVAGYILIGTLVRTTDGVFLMSIQGFLAMPNLPPYYFVVSLITDSLYSLLGGYVCSMVAQTRARNAVTGLIITVAMIGVSSLFALWNTVPHWFGIALIGVSPVFIWIGGQLSLRLRKTGEAAPPKKEV
jgi:hypothetical protein